ncbi:MAG: tetratricopeptide repeat protein [Acidimicrobiia bacterium]
MSAVATSARPQSAPLIVLIAVLMAASIGVQVVRDRGWQPYQPENPTLWVESGPFLQRLSLGFDSLVADIYWIRSVVYYGGKRRAEGANRSYESLYPLLNLVTTLDPHFRIAYRFGSLFLTEPPPAGPGRPDHAVQLLTRGIERDFGRWEYFYDIGFVYYWSLRDYPKAAEWFLKGADRPGAAEWLRPLAATALATGGERTTSRRLWSELLNSDMSFMRSQAELRLMQLDAMDAIAELTPVLQRFIDRERRFPRSWQELADVERLPKVPTDPTGMPFYFDSKVGYIDVSPKSPLWPLPLNVRQPPPPPS